MVLLVGQDKNRRWRSKNHEKVKLYEEARKAKNMDPVKATEKRNYKAKKQKERRDVIKLKVILSFMACNY